MSASTCRVIVDREPHSVRGRLPLPLQLVHVVPDVIIIIIIIIIIFIIIIIIIPHLVSGFSHPHSSSSKLQSPGLAAATWGAVGHTPGAMEMSSMAMLPSPLRPTTPSNTICKPDQ